MESLNNVSPGISFYALLLVLFVPLIIFGFFQDTWSSRKRRISHKTLSQKSRRLSRINDPECINEVEGLRERNTSSLSNVEMEHVTNKVKQIDEKITNTEDDSNLQPSKHKIFNFLQFSPLKLNRRLDRPILWSLFLGVGACIVTFFLIPQIQILTLNAGLSGLDLNKGTKAKMIPESLGIVPGTVYVAVMCCVSLLVNRREYFAGLFCSLFMLYLGFADDVLELRWRYKLVLPGLATLPLLVAYEGITTLVIPKPIRFWINFRSMDIGILYHIYMWLVSIYCSNTINIYAGINGLEVSQALIIACSVLLHNLIELRGPDQRPHVFSMVCMIPFIFTTIPLLYYNWYPARVFVGDTYTYYAGMTLAVVGILGHFSKTLMLFFIPQWINFFYSLPQLLGLIPCPRHRLPIFNESTGLLESSGNWTIVNLALDIFGPMSEENLCLLLCAFQIVCCGFGFFIRYRISKYFY